MHIGDENVADVPKIDPGFIPLYFLTDCFFKIKKWSGTKMGSQSATLSVTFSSAHIGSMYPAHIFHAN